jgi:hypothetical protein
LAKWETEEVKPTFLDLKRIIEHGTKKPEVEKWAEAFEENLRRIISEYHPSRGEVRLSRIMLEEIEE